MNIQNMNIQNMNIQNMNIQEIRKHRIQLERYPFYNDKNEGMALFDLTLSFVGAFILDYFFNISNYLSCKNKKYIYYLLVIPFGIIIHHIIAHINTNFSVLFPPEITFLNKALFSRELNIYKLLILINIVAIFLMC